MIKETTNTMVPWVLTMTKSQEYKLNSLLPRFQKLKFNLQNQNTSNPEYQMPSLNQKKQQTDFQNLSLSTKHKLAQEMRSQSINSQQQSQNKSLARDWAQPKLLSRIWTQSIM